MQNIKHAWAVGRGRGNQCRQLKRKKALSGTAVPPLPKGEAKVWSIGSPFGRAVNLGLTERAPFGRAQTVEKPLH